VLAIENLIVISSEPIPSDVADRANQAFKRDAIIDESTIKVTNDGRTTYLTGVVGRMPPCAKRSTPRGKRPASTTS
jgi:hypothetical protein